MGRTTQYLRYVPGSVFGIVTSPCANILFADSSMDKNCVIVPACENALMWNFKTRKPIKCFKGEKHAVTVIHEASKKSVAVGYADGSIRVFDMHSEDGPVLFQGHRSPVSCLAYDSEGHRLASGGKDTEIVIWDVVDDNGLFRLKGHKGPIIKCQFVNGRNILISSSEDTFLKFWDLDIRLCFKTIKNPVQCNFVLLNSHRLITGIDDATLKVWDLTFKETPFLTSEDGTREGETLWMQEVGKILTEDEKTTTSLCVDSTERLLGCHGYSNTLQLFKLLTDEESTKRMRIRRKKERKARNAAGDLTAELSDLKITLSDEIKRLKSLKMEAKIVAFSIQMESDDNAKIAVLLNNNSFSVFRLDVNQDSGAELWCSIVTPGHRSKVSTLAFSSDNEALLSTSTESMKIWNYENQKCNYTFQCDHAFCSTFVTGDNYCIVGTKMGKLQIFDMSTQGLVETVDAHADSTNALSPNPNGGGIVSGGKDKDIKFWDYKLVNDADYSETKKRLTLSLVHTKKMDDEILCLKYCPNQKYLAASLLDYTVRVFFIDTLNLAFKLYGHKLPVSCIDISYDSTLLVSGSKDRNVKIWSLEFGNCLKSIFAHAGSVTCLQFLPKTHMFFSGGADKKLKQWDADNFQKVITLEGHQGKVNAISISHDGRTVATCSDDKSIRLWEKTDEPLILEEERENERDLEAEAELALGDHVVVGESNEDTGLATSRTVETIKSAEQLIEAIDIYKEEIAKLEEHRLQCKCAKETIPPPAPHPLLIAYSLTCPYRFMLKMLKKLQASTLKQTLLHMPFHYVIDLLKILSELSERNWEIELCTRCALFLFRIHLRQILTCHDMLSILSKFQKLLVPGLADGKDNAGLGLAGLPCLQKDVEEAGETSQFRDVGKVFERKGRKRRFVNFV